MSNSGVTADHDHVSGYLRGWIHQGCNKGLGHFNDDPTKLRKAAEYLEIFMEKEKSRVRTTGECLGGCKSEGPDARSILAGVSGVQTAPVKKVGEVDKFPGEGTSEKYECCGY
jgi:hypothetical protein